MRTTSHVSRIEIRSPAKVNLFLEILGRREDGFHEIETVMTTVSLYDSLRFVIRNDTNLRISISPRCSAVPANENNLIIQAINKCREYCSTPDQLPGIDVVLKKRIPSAAGLGGASGNAAATIIAIWSSSFLIFKMWLSVAISSWPTSRRVAKASSVAACHSRRMSSSSRYRR